MSMLKLMTEFGIGLAIINLILQGIGWASVLLFVTAVCFFWGAHTGEKDA